MDHLAIRILVTATIFSLMFSIGINHSLGELVAVWQKPGWMLRALLVVLILVPLVVGLLVWLLDLPASAAAGLILLAAAPGATHDQTIPDGRCRPGFFGGIATHSGRVGSGDHTSLPVDVLRHLYTPGRHCLARR
jgi:hypothetical protein